MFFIDLDFIILNIFLLLVFTIAGMLVNRGYSYFKSSLTCVLAFSLIEGARYMRGNDYAHYLDVYNYDLEDGQKLYTWFCDLLKYFGVPDYLSFFFYALIFSTCLFIFLYRYKKGAQLIFPLALIALLFFHEFMIRQELSYAFVFLYLSSLFSMSSELHIYKHKLRFKWCRNYYLHLALCMLFATCALSIHTGNFFVILILTILYCFKIEAISWKISVPILIFAAYVFPFLIDLSGLEPILNVLFSESDKLSSYTGRFDFWFGQEAMNDEYTRKPVVMVYELLGHFSLMYLFCRINSKTAFSLPVKTLFNGYVVGIIVLNAFRNLEILNRMGYVFYIMWFIPLSGVLLLSRRVRLHKWERFLYIFLTFFAYDYLKYIFVNNEMTLFLWDAELL